MINFFQGERIGFIMSKKHRVIKQKVFRAINKNQDSMITMIQGHNNQGALMKFFIVFFLLFSVFHGYSPSAEAVSFESPSSKEALTLLRRQLKRYVDPLMLMLLDEDTPRENQMEILEEIRNIADINGEITVALNQISQSGMGQNEINIKEDTGRDEDISVWAKSQVELIRRKQLALNELERRETKLDEDFWVHLALDGVVIVAGGVLFFVPAVGPAVSIPLTAGHIAITGQRLGVLLMATGFAGSGLDVWNYIFGEEKKVPSFVSDIAFRDVFTKEIFNILSSPNQSDRYLAVNLLKSAVDEETLISDLLIAIQDERRSAEVRQSAIRALRSMSDMEEGLRKEVVGVLKRVIDESQIPSLRETSVVVLGEIGRGMPEVAEYLFDRGGDASNSDELRLISLIEFGRSEDYFSVSIEMLSKWLKGRNYEKNPLRIQPDIPDSFRDSLLSVKRRKSSESHTIVLKEFIRSGILDVDLKIEFSETLLSWDDSPENKALLREVYSNPAEDIRRYVENDLFGGDLFEESYGASQFLQGELRKVEKSSTKNLTKAINLIINKFDKDYPHQEKISENLKVFIENYKKIQESIKN